MNNREFRIGLIGASWIAPQVILDPGSILDNAKVVAVAARDRARLIEYAMLHRIPQTFFSYEALIEDESIDVVYISLPPSHHAYWSIRALNSGKHVICEKPTAMNGFEATEMVNASKASGKRLFEAMHSRYHPAFEQCRQWINDGHIGELSELRAHFGVGIADDGVKNQYRPELGGGCVMDMGCYPYHWSTQLINSNVQDIAASLDVAESGVDEKMAAVITFANGVQSVISSCMQPDEPFKASLEVTGSKGSISFENPLVPHQDGALSLLCEGSEVKASVSTISTYCYQLKAMLHAIESNTPVPTESDALIEQQHGIDRIYAAAGLSHLRQSTYTG